MSRKSDAKKKQHAIEVFFNGNPISVALKVADVGGQRIFPVTPKPNEVIVFLEFNGYRKCVRFPVKKAPQNEK
jgi:hypothetical protein